MLSAFAASAFPARVTSAARSFVSTRSAAILAASSVSIFPCSVLSAPVLSVTSCAIAPVFVAMSVMF